MEYTYKIRSFISDEDLNEVFTVLDNLKIEKL